MSAPSYVRTALALGSLFGLVLSGCADGTSADALADASSDAVTSTVTTTSTSTSSDGNSVDPSLDVPFVDEVPRITDGGTMDSSSDEPARDASSDLPDSSCPTGQHLSYAAAGCGAAAKLVCVDETSKACGMLNYYCECDGVTTYMVGACGGFSDKPYLHQGACRVDAATDAEAPCRMEREVFTCQPGWSSMLCCPPVFDGTLASVPGCDPENLDESTSVGSCDDLEVLHRVSATGGTITCAYATAGNLVGTYVREGSSMVIPFCMTSRTAISGEAIPATCDLTSLPLIRSCAR